ncbi:MAG: aminoglycoside phosphotransferase family protein [Niabella sp.]|nr:aminoglycoside phosphotransferase family protein [Niabella sp.]
MDRILAGFGLKMSECSLTPFGNGLINHTWILKNAEGDFILQKVNSNVFTKPEDIASNFDLIENYLKQTGQNYFFVAPVKTTDGKSLFFIEGDGYYRLFPFVAGSHSIVVVGNEDQAREAAKQFGLFTKVLSGIDVDRLKITLPSFHDLSLRYQQFLEALETGNRERIDAAAGLINELKDHSRIADRYEAIKINPGFKKRVTHHDTKISNVLFNQNNKGICVIDLDTVMPGYFISDVGDMMRTYLSPVSEEEKDFDKIEIRDAYYKAIVQGYLEQMNEELTPIEKEHFFYSGLFMIYMQALRFLTDHLNNDRYYGAKYEGHNLVRAQNQAVLLKRLLEKQELLTAAIFLAASE